VPLIVSMIVFFSRFVSMEAAAAVCSVISDSLVALAVGGLD
jgi:hypothetical protein